MKKTFQNHHLFFILKIFQYQNLFQFRTPSLKRQNRESYLGNDYPARDTEAVQVDRGDGTKGRRGKKCEKLNKSKYRCIENFFLGF